MHQVFDLVALERNTSATCTENEPSESGISFIFDNQRVQSVINVNEGPKAGFLIVDANAELWLNGAAADVPLIA